MCIKVKSNLVKTASISISQNKSGLITEVLINHDLTVNVTSITPYTMSLDPGTFTFSIIKEVNESNGKTLNMTYNATITYTIQKVKLVLHQKVLCYSGIVGTIIGFLIYVIRKLGRGSKVSCFVSKRTNYSVYGFSYFRKMILYRTSIFYDLKFIV